MKNQVKHPKLPFVLTFAVLIFLARASFAHGKFQMTPAQQATFEKCLTDNNITPPKHLTKEQKAALTPEQKAERREQREAFWSGLSSGQRDALRTCRQTAKGESSGN